MKQSHFNLSKKIIFFLLTILMFFSITRANVLLAFFSVVFSMFILSLLKKQVKDVLVDERVQAVGQKAAQATLSIFGAIMGTISFLLLTLGTGEQIYPRALGVVFSYITIFILFLYVLTYWFFNKELGGNEK